jgi:AcrR family transcriptional regulator
MAVSSRKTSRRTQLERRSNAERRLLDAAIQLIVGGGVGSVTFARVGELSGYSRGLVSHYFGTKAALLEAVAADVQERFAQLVTREVDGASGLEVIMIVTKQYLRLLRADSHLLDAFTILWADAATHESDLRPVVAERQRFARELLAKVVRAGIDDGSVRADVEPDVFAATHLLWLGALTLQRRLQARGFSLAAVEREVLATLRARLATP